MIFFVSKKKFELETAKRTAEACDQIMSEMGAEIHDDLKQKLFVFGLYIDLIERSSNNPIEIESLAIKMRSDFEQMNRTVGSVSRRLLLGQTEGKTLADTLSMLCQDMEQPRTGNIHFEYEGSPILLKNTIERHLLRIVQELIHNAFKHSSAWHVWVRLKWKTDKLIIQVEDDGSGGAKIPEFIQRLKKKNNTLKMRTHAIGASIKYLQGTKGLLASLELNLSHS
jgi:two-component system sensor histidine kinase DegS